jgi:hypothetical protein
MMNAIIISDKNTFNYKNPKTVKYKFTPYYCDKIQGMNLRSGKTINCIINTEFFNSIFELSQEVSMWKIYKIKINTYTIINKILEFAYCFYEDMYKHKDLKVLYKFLKYIINIMIKHSKINETICDYEMRFEDWDYRCRCPIYIEKCYLYDDQVNNINLEQNDTFNTKHNNNHNNNYNNNHIHTHNIIDGEITIINNPSCKNKEIYLSKLMYWKSKFTIPHSSVKKYTLYKKLLDYTNEDCCNIIFEYL